MAKKEKLSLEELLEQALVKDEDKFYEVPKNWVWVRLGTVCIINPPKINSKSLPENLEVSFIPMSAVSEISGTVVTDEIRKLYEVKNGYTNFLDNDVLFAKITPCMENGKSTIVMNLTNGIGYGSTEFYVIRVNKCVTNKFIYYLVRAKWFRERAKMYMSGSVGQQRVPKSYLENYNFPLPPLPEQQRIVALIESLFEKLNRAKELAQNALDSFENRKSAILHKAFTGELTRKWREKNGVVLESWDKKSLSKLCSKITDGEHFRPPIVDSGIPFLSAKDIRDGYISFDNILYVSKETAEKALKRCNPEKGDVLIVSRGATVGRMCVVNTDDVFCLLGSVILLKVENMQSKLVCYFMNSPKISQQLKEISGATAQQAIYLRDIKGIMLPVPSYQEQQEIVRILDNLLDNEQKAKEPCDVIDKIDYMKKSILARAFRGELGTNNPAEESALELIKEVLKEKAQ